MTKVSAAHELSGAHQEGLAAPDNRVVDVGSHLGIGHSSPGDDVIACLVTGQPVPAAEVAMLA